MKKKTIGLALFSVSILAAQTLTGPALMAQEVKSATSSSRHIDEQALANREIAENIPVLEEAEPTEISPLSPDNQEEPTSPEVPSEPEEEPTSPEVPSEPEEEPTSPEVPSEPEEEPASPEVPSEPEEEPTSPEVPSEPEEEPTSPEVPSEPEEEPASPEVPNEPKDPELEESGKVEQPPVSDNSNNRPDSQQPTIVGEIPVAPTQPSVQQPGVPSAFPSLFTSSGNATNYLPESFRRSEVAGSTLGSYVLPLLNSFEYEWQAVLVYDIVRQIGVSQEDNVTNQEWIDALFASLFDTEIKGIELEEIAVHSVQPGDIVYDETEDDLMLLGVSLDSNFLVAMITEEQPEVTEDAEMVSQLVLSPSQQVLSDSSEEEATVFVKRVNDIQLTSEGEELLAHYPAPFDFQVNQDTRNFITEIGEEARKLGSEYDVFASVLIAQAILESGGGSSQLSQAPYHNLFGIKGSYDGGTVVMATNEDRGNGELVEIQDAFRVYPSYDQSLADYIQLIRGGVSHDTAFYQEVWRSEAQNYLRATDALTGTYATDTSYNRKLNSLIAAYELTQYDQPIINESGLFIQGTDSIPAEYRELMRFPAYDGVNYNISGSYPVGQCTWYAFNRVAQLGGRVDDYMGNGGDWGTNGRRLGYQVSHTPRAGTLISFSPTLAGSDPTYGHVAFVEAVGPNGILISEGNVLDSSTISYRVLSNELAYSPMVSYITPK